MSEADKVPSCCICGISCDKIAKDPKWVLGNNPWPVSDDPNDRACDICNDFIVVPQRLAKAFEHITKRKEIV